jgi:hypothetical protein
MRHCAFSFGFTRRASQGAALVGSPDRNHSFTFDYEIAVVANTEMA